jgi:type I restriction enzyme S subunit
VRAGWQESPIGDVFRVVNGGTPKTGVAAYWDGPHAWITPAEMGGLETPLLSGSRRTLTDDGLRVGAELVPEGSIILSTRAPIGHLVVNEVPMAFNQGCKGLVPSSGVDTKFAYYFLLANVPLLESLGTGATFKELSGGKLKEVPFRFPELREQRRIVAILDEAFEGIATAKAHAEKNLRNARELFETLHQSVFANAGEGWIEQKLGDIASFRNGLNYTKQSKGQTVLIIGVKDFQNHFWAPIDDLDSVTLDGELSETDSLVEGDILSVRSNGNPALIGRCMLVGVLSGPVSHSGFTIRIRLHRSGALPQYVCQFLKSQEVRRKLVDGGNGANIKSLNQGTLSAVVVPLPPVETQQKLIARIEAMSDETNRLADVATRKLAALNELKQSFLHQAFSGAL